MSDSWPRPGRSFKPSQNAQIGARSAAKCPLEAVTRLIWGHSGPWPGSHTGADSKFCGIAKKPIQQRDDHGIVDLGADPRSCRSPVENDSYSTVFVEDGLVSVCPAGPMILKGTCLAQPNPHTKSYRHQGHGGARQPLCDARSPHHRARAHHNALDRRFHTRVSSIHGQLLHGQIPTGPLVP